MTRSEVAWWAKWYSGMGLNPLPSSVEKRRPELYRYGLGPGYAYERDHGVQRFILDGWKSRNIQVATGRRWGVIVIDCDGPIALARWNTLLRKNGGVDPTWVVISGGSGRGNDRRHYWFSVPRDGPPIPKRPIWSIERQRPDGTKVHVNGTLLEVIGDSSLVIVPPSVHRKTGNEYRFAPGCGPWDTDRPSVAPRWLLDLVERREEVRPPGPIVRPSARADRSPGGHFDWNAVRMSIGPEQALGLARSWGLDLVGRGTSGWYRCRRIGFRDENPSAAFHPEYKYYVDMIDRTYKLNFPALAVALGAYPDYCSAVNELGRGFLS